MKAVKSTNFDAQVARTNWLVGPAYESSQYRHNMAADIRLRCLQLYDALAKKF
jgi:hypothetical protein